MSQSDARPVKPVPSPSDWQGWAQRALALLRGLHLALARAGEEELFLREICQLLVEEGGYPLAWVGLAEKDQSLVRVAHAGLGLGLVDLLPRSWAPEVAGNDPTAVAVRSRQPSFCPDLQAEPACAPYAGAAAALGLISCFAVPLLHQGQVLGVLTVYAAGAGAFSADERELLRTLATVCAQGLAALRLRKELARLETHLAFKTQLLDSSPYSIFVFDLEDRLLCLNQAACQSRGFSRQELLGLAFKDLETPEFQPEAEAKRLLLLSHPENTVIFESRHRRQDGTSFPVENYCRVVEWNGRKAILRVVLDITERQELLRILRETEEHYRIIFESPQVGIFRIRLSDGRVLEANDRFARMLGYAGMEDLKRHFVARERLVEPMALEQLLQAAENGRLTNFETRFFRQDGSVAWFLCSFRISAERDCLEGVATDITELRQARESLEEAQLRHRSLVEQLLGRLLLLTVEQQQLAKELQQQKEVFDNLLALSEEGVAAFDPELAVTLWNPAMERFTGIPRPAALGQNLLKLLPGLQDKRAPGLGGRRTLQAGDKPLRLTASGPEGYFTLQLAPSVDETGKIQGGILLCRDFTSARRLEANLREHQCLLHGILAAAEDGIAVLDRQLTILRANATLEKWFAHDLPLLGKHCYAVIHGALEPCENCPALRTLVSGEPAREVTSKFGPSGLEEGKFDLLAIPLKDPQSGEIVGVILRIKDLTPRLQLEERLRKTEESLSLVLRNLPILVGRLYPDGTVVFLEDNLEKLTGYSPREFAPGGRPLSELILPEDQEQARRALLHALATTRSYVRQYRLRTKDERLLWLQESGQIAVDEQGRMLYADIVLLDITERKQAEEMRPQLEAQLRQAQRMDAIGSLAGGIAHDFNNILGVMLGYTEMALMSLKEDDGLRRRLQQVLKAGKRGKELVSQILSFSRPRPQERKPVHLSSVIKETMNMLRATLPATIELRMDLEEERDVILADSTQMHQVILNLCANAAHAMREKGGVLHISLTALDLDANTAAQFHGLAPGPHVCLSVKDTGHGMDRETMEKIFDPFFTTKKMEEGTGMGLAVVHGIVKAHKGAIIVDSEVGKGSEFRIYLPRVEAVEVPAITEAQEVGNGQERILFVDDEEWLVDMWKEILESLGYRLTVTTRPLEALALFRERPQEFDLVIADQTMPQMTGMELARELLAIRPDLPILLVTGYSHLVTPEKAKEAGIRELIMKPLSISELTGAIKKVLGKESPA